jgi:tripartite-type tricarboxylate transporter receptor subunit TctC
MQTPALQKQLTALGIEPVFGTPDEFTALIQADIPKWAEIVRKSGAKAE